MKRDGIVFYFIVENENKNVTLNDRAINETMEEIKMSIPVNVYETFAGPSVRSSLFMKKEFEDNALNLINIIFVDKDLNTYFLGQEDVQKVYDRIKKIDEEVDTVDIINTVIKELF